jgi:hypothetical protein
MAKASKFKKNAQLGRQDRWPSDYGVRQSEGEQPEAVRDGSWSSAEQAQGREGRSKGHGGSGGEGTGHRGSKERLRKPRIEPRPK